MSDIGRAKLEICITLYILLTFVSVIKALRIFILSYNVKRRMIFFHDFSIIFNHINVISKRLFFYIMKRLVNATLEFLRSIKQWNDINRIIIIFLWLNLQPWMSYFIFRFEILIFQKDRRRIDLTYVRYNFSFCDFMNSLLRVFNTIFTFLFSD